MGLIKLAGGITLRSGPADVSDDPHHPTLDRGLVFVLGIGDPPSDGTLSRPSSVPPRIR